MRRGFQDAALVVEQIDDPAVAARRILRFLEHPREQPVEVSLRGERRGDVEESADRSPHIPHRPPQPEYFIDPGAR
ncbi:hypothetical protein D3C83_29790 [compost metagenome]